jgi:hypothetical protein
VKLGDQAGGLPTIKSFEIKQIIERPIRPIAYIILPGSASFFIDGLLKWC